MDVQQLVQAGVDRYQSGDFSAAVEPWLIAYATYETTENISALAVVSENLARAYQQMGQTPTELSYWERAITATQALRNYPKLGRLLTEQAQAHSRLGQHSRAIAILCGEETVSEVEFCQPGSALEIAETAEDTIGQVSALGSLGEAYRLSGRSGKAITVLKQGVTISHGLGDAAIESALLNSLGNTLASLAEVGYRRADEAEERGGDNDATALREKADERNLEAIGLFQESYRLALSKPVASGQMRSLLSLVPAYERAGNQTASRQHWQLAADLLDQLPDSQVKAFAAIKLADFLEPLSIRSLQTRLNSTVPSPAVEAQAVELLNRALTIGEVIENSRVSSFALGKLGNLDERAGRYTSALEKTQLARLAADQDLAAQDSLYLWEWQTGRILKAQGNLSDAGQAYGQAVNVLEQIRSDMLNANRDLQFDFRDTVEPLYRQYAALNLKAVPAGIVIEKGEPAFEELDATLVALDSLKIAELQSYFANDCVVVPARTRVDAVDDSEATAVLSTAILDAESSPAGKQNSSSKQLVVIMSLPDGSKKVVQTPVELQKIEREIKKFRNALEAGYKSISEYREEIEPSQQLYDWLIRPFEQDLFEQGLKNVKTLVFLNDGLLRSVPMAALHDGQQYLIEKVAVAVTPSLRLTDPKRTPRPTALNALLMGVSDKPNVEGRFFDGLSAVEQELETVAQKLPNSASLINENFSLAALKAALAAKDYRILHMATHGTFGFDPADNFIVAGAKRAGEGSQFNETLTISELDSIIRSTSDPTRDPIELLTLTACETAIGDNRSTLGLAGVAIQAGVRSAIATLWSVGDESSANLIVQFYENLQTPVETKELTKAEALKKAQIAMINSDNFNDQHPYRWAPFILIGNWL